MLYLLTTYYIKWTNSWEIFMKSWKFAKIISPEIMSFLFLLQMISHKVFCSFCRPSKRQNKLIFCLSHSEILFPKVFLSLCRAEIGENKLILSFSRSEISFPKVFLSHSWLEIRENKIILRLSRAEISLQKSFIEIFA